MFPLGNPVRADLPMSDLLELALLNAAEMRRLRQLASSREETLLTVVGARDAGIDLALYHVDVARQVWAPNHPDVGEPPAAPGLELVPDTEPDIERNAKESP